METRKAVVGLVDIQSQAATVFDDLRKNGFSSEDISMVFATTQGGRQIVLEENTKAPEGALVGVGAGGALGGTLGLLAGLGALAIPGIGPILAAGPLFGVLSGLVAGAAVGGVTGALIGVGVPEVEAKQYESRIRAGKILISVHVDAPDARILARRVLERHGATHVMSIDEHNQTAGKAA